MFIVIIPLILVGSIAASYWKCRSFVNPMSVLTVWWCGWLFTANLSLTGVDVPGRYTQFLYLLMVVSMVLGGLLSHPFRAKNPKYENNIIARKWKWVIIVVVPISVVVAYFFYKAYTSYLSSITSVARGEIFGSNSVLFPSGNIELLYGMLTRPILLAGLIGGASLFIWKSTWKLYVYVSFIYVLDSIMMIGRKNIYALIIISLFMMYVMPSKNMSIKLSNTRKYFVAIVFSLGLVLILVTSWRLGGSLDVQSVAKNYVIKYHTGGFALVDNHLNSEGSRVNETLTYGRSTLGVLEKSFVILFVRSFDQSVSPASNQNGAAFLDFEPVGVSPQGKDMVMNAFNTILYTLYIDGREFFVFLIPFIFGWFMMGHYFSWRIQNRVHSLMMTSFFVYIGFMGLFNTPIGNGLFWGTLFLIVGVNRLKIPAPRLNLKRVLIK